MLYFFTNVYFAIDISVADKIWFSYSHEETVELDLKSWCKIVLIYKFIPASQFDFIKGMLINKEQS